MSYKLRSTSIVIAVTLLFGINLAYGQSNTDFLPPNTTYHYADVRGVKLFYREVGDSTKPTIVLLHGFPGSSFYYRNLIPMLATRYHVIAPDNLGSGNSEHKSPDILHYTFDTLAYYNQQLLNQLHIQHYAIYMFDFGAPVGYRLMMKDPAKITALIIQNANAYMDGLTPQRQEFFKSAYFKKDPETLNKLFDYTGKDAVVNRQYFFDIPKEKDYTMSPDGWNMDLHFLHDTLSRRIQVQLFQDYYNNLLQYPTWQAMLKKAQPKTLIVWGGKDQKFIEAGAKAYLRDVPKAELHILDAGHFALEEQPGQIARIILDFLKANKL